MNSKKLNFPLNSGLNSGLNFRLNSGLNFAKLNMGRMILVKHLQGIKKLNF